MKNSNQEMQPLFGVVREDAIGMLVADHKRVARLFAEFKRLTDEGEETGKAELVRQICDELTLHMQVEEELFYPAFREATQDEEQEGEAWVEHAGAKQLIAQLREADPSEPLYTAKVTVLGEQIDHHVEEEEGSMFPKARAAGLDTTRLGAAMLGRKEELGAGAPMDPAPPPTPSRPPRPTAKSKAKVKAKAKSRPKAKAKASTPKKRPQPRRGKPKRGRG